MTRRDRTIVRQGAKHCSICDGRGYTGNVYTTAHSCALCYRREASARNAGKVSRGRPETHPGALAVALQMVADGVPMTVNGVRL